MFWAELFGCHAWHPGDIVPLVILAHTAPTGCFRAAADRIGRLSGVTAPSVYYSVAD